ncbi:MAG: metallophosphoesterase [Bacteroidales bacterium]|nr:metallophosphoesterase [Bacteroidales bacterium]
MKKILIAAMLLIMCSLGASAQKLVILHTNDTHSHLDAERDGQGGVIERAAFIDSVRRAEGKRNVLLIDGGDWNQGTSYFNVLGGDLEVSLLNAFGYDCVCLGNHEFDNGLEDLARRVKALNMPVVCANYDFSPFELGQYVKPYTVIKRGGMKIGIIGILCDITSVVSRSTADRIPKLDTVPVVNKYARILREEEKCDFVILLSHAGYAGRFSDCAISEQISGVDLIVGGHSHTFLKEMDTTHKGTDGKTIPIVQDGHWGLEVGVVKVY